MKSYLWGLIAVVSTLPATAYEQDGLLPPRNVRDGKITAVTLPVAVTPLPPAAVARQKQGDSLLRGGDFAGAARSYAQAAEIAPRDPVLRLLTGVALSAAHHPDPALAQFRRAVALADNDVIASLLLQSALSERGEAAEAQEVYQETYRRFPLAGKPGALSATASVTRLKAALASDRESAILYLLLGDAHQLGENWADADAAYQSAIRYAPRWSKPYINRGVALLAQGKMDGAIVSFTQALRLDPGDAQAQVFKGEAEMRSGQNGRAISTLQRVASDNRVGFSLKFQATTGLGQALANTKSYGKAVSTLGAAQRMAPNDPTPSAMIGEVQLQAGNYDEAARAYDTALRITRSGGLFANRPVLYRALAETQLSARKPADALQTLTKALTDEPASAPLWYRLSAQAHFDTGDRAQAEQDLCLALDSEQERFPFDTLNALAARGLIAGVRARYGRDLDLATTGKSVTAGPSGVSVTMTHRAGAGRQAISEPNAPAARALAALSHIARYEGRIKDEIALRLRLSQTRTRGGDWFLLAETYDVRAGEPVHARDAYLRSLEIGNLTPAQTEWARRRLETLTAPLYKP